MQVGDPKKTALLGVVAVGAIGFLFSRVFGGGGDAPKAMRQANGSPDAVSAPATGAMSTTSLAQLTNDPFSHSRLARLAVNTPGTTAPNSGGAAPNVDPLPSGNGGGAADPSNGMFGITKDTPGDWAKPVEPGQKPAGVSVDKLTTLTLRAIVKVDRRMAYLVVNGDEARGFKAGDSVTKDVVVVIVNDDSVILKTNTRTVTLKVGQQGEL